MAITFDSISTTTLASATTSISFTSLPTTYTDLRFVLFCNSLSGSADLLLRFNNDSNNNYSYTQGGTTQTGTGSFGNNLNVSFMYVGGMGEWAAGTPGNTSGFIIDIFSYRNGYRKGLFVKPVENGAFANTLWQRNKIGEYFDTNPITTITFSATQSIAAGSKFSLYGITRA